MYSSSTLLTDTLQKVGYIPVQGRSYIIASVISEKTLANWLEHNETQIQ